MHNYVKTQDFLYNSALMDAEMEGLNGQIDERRHRCAIFCPYLGNC